LVPSLSSQIWQQGGFLVLRRLVLLTFCAFVLPVSAAQAWTWPVDGPVLRPFSFDRAHPYAAGQHRGLDLGAAAGANVRAPADGVVSFAGTVPTGGKTVSIETPSGYTATLVHLGSIEVVRGARVGEGAVVGTVGPSGVVDLDAPFVYFGLRVTSEQQGYVDPLSFLPARPVPAAPAESEPAAQPVAAAAVVPAVSAEVAPQPASQPAPLAEPASQAPALASVTDVDSRASAASTAARRTTVGSHTATRTAARSQAAAPRPVVRSTEVRHSVQRNARSTSVGHATLPSAMAHTERPDALVSAQRLHARSPLTAHSTSNVPTWLVGGFVTLAALCLAGLRARAVCRKRPPIMVPVERESSFVAAGAKAHPEGFGGAGMAVCIGQASSGPRGRVRRAGRHLRAVSPVEGQRRPDGEWYGRTRDARYGHGGSRRRVAA